jgi:recombination protein RecA
MATMGKPFDISKFRKSITKSIEGLGIGFNDPTDWISTGNYTLNYLLSGDFNKGIPMGKVTVFAGESGAGKSFICSGNIVRHAQEQGIYVILIDTENALDEAWLHALGVDTDESKLLKLNMAMIDDVAKVISDFVKEYRTLPEDDRPKVLFVLDSLGMMLTPTDVNQFEAGEMKGDMGRKPKALTALVRNCVNMFGTLNLGLVATNHTYASQDMFDPDDKISGGQGFIYASSIVVAMRKLKLKTDADGNKTTTVNGIRAACKIMKTRYAKPFESVQVEIPYETGMSPYSGMVDMLEAKGLLSKEGNSLVYKFADGKTIKQFRKAWEKNEDSSLDKVMAELSSNVSKLLSTEVTEIKDEDLNSTPVSQPKVDEEGVTE